MTSRRERLAVWWATARSTWLLATWEARFWVLIAIVGVVLKSVRESIPVLFFLSAYANAKGAKAQAQGAKIEMKAEEAEDPESPAQ